MAAANASSRRAGPRGAEGRCGGPGPFYMAVRRRPPASGGPACGASECSAGVCVGAHRPVCRGRSTSAGRQVMNLLPRLRGRMNAALPDISPMCLNCGVPEPQSAAVRMLQVAWACGSSECGIGTLWAAGAARPASVDLIQQAGGPCPGNRVRRNACVPRCPACRHAPVSPDCGNPSLSRPAGRGPAATPARPRRPARTRRGPSRGGRCSPRRPCRPLAARGPRRAARRRG